MTSRPEPIIEVAGVSKKFRVYRTPADRLREALWGQRRKFHKEFWALQDVSFTVERGATVGIVGRNGAGKTTLLEVIAGVLQPTTGDVTVRGRVASLLELGSGFNAEFTGRENVFLAGAIAGYSRAELEKRFPVIEAFAEIGAFIDQPAKTYSSGMFVRLAFSMAINVDPEILIIDEALAVGDVIFQHRCMKRLREIQAGGCTILFVSHNTGAVKMLCRQAVFLEQGRLIAAGDAEDVINRYHAHVASLEASHMEAPPVPERGAQVTVAEPGLSNGAHPGWTVDARFDDRVRAQRHGTGDAAIRAVEIVNAAGQQTMTVEFDAPVTIRIYVEFLRPVPESILGLLIRDDLGVDITGMNTYQMNTPLGPSQAGRRLRVDFALRLPLRPGTYSVNPGLAYDAISARYLDWVNNALVFQMFPPADGRPVYGMVYLPTDLSIVENPS